MIHAKADYDGVKTIWADELEEDSQEAEMMQARKILRNNLRDDA